MLLLTGGLTAMQTFQLTTGLPLAVIMLAMCYGLYKALHADLHDDALISVVQDGTVATHSEDGQRPQEIDAW